MVDKSRVVCPICDSINAVPADRPAEAAKCGRCHAKLFQGEPVELSGARLQKHLANSDVPVIVDFWRPGVVRVGRWPRSSSAPPTTWSPGRGS